MEHLKSCVNCASRDLVTFKNKNGTYVFRKECPKCWSEINARKSMERRAERTPQVYKECYNCGNIQHKQYGEHCKKCGFKVGRYEF